MGNFDDIPSKIGVVLATSTSQAKDDYLSAQKQCNNESDAKPLAE